MITLIVKGTIDDACQAALAHGVNLESAVRHPRFDETICRALSIYESAAQKWFGETIGVAPFPAGTLTWYGAVRAPDDADKVAVLGAFPAKPRVFGTRKRGEPWPIKLKENAKADWEYEVSNGGTVLGFDDWLAHRANTWEPSAAVK